MAQQQEQKFVIINEVPFEIYQKICNYCDVNTLLRISCTSKQMFDCIQEPLFLNHPTYYANFIKKFKIEYATEIINYMILTRTDTERLINIRTINEKYCKFPCDIQNVISLETLKNHQPTKNLDLTKTHVTHIYLNDLMCWADTDIEININEKNIKSFHSSYNYYLNTYKCENIESATIFNEYMFNSFINKNKINDLVLSNFNIETKCLNDILKHIPNIKCLKTCACYDFSDCKHLEKLYLVECPINTVYDVTNLKDLQIYNYYRNIDFARFLFLKKIKLYNITTALKNNAFDYCNNLKSISIKRVNNISSNTFTLLNPEKITKIQTDTLHQFEFEKMINLKCLKLKLKKDRYFDFNKVKNIKKLSISYDNDLKIDDLKFDISCLQELILFETTNIFYREINKSNKFILSFPKLKILICPEHFVDSDIKKILTDKFCSIVYY